MVGGRQLKSILHFSTVGGIRPLMPCLPLILPLIHYLLSWLYHSLAILLHHSLAILLHHSRLHHWLDVLLHHRLLGPEVVLNRLVILGDIIYCSTTISVSALIAYLSLGSVRLTWSQIVLGCRKELLTASPI